MPRQVSEGEQLLLVVGGVFPTQEGALAANDEFDFGEMQGFYAVPVGQFGGLRSSLRDPGAWALVSAFRTRAGAEEFEALADMAGAHAFITPRVSAFGGVFAGLGQEANPDGTGPLLEAVEASRPAGQ